MTMLKVDQYRKARGGYSRFLKIFCEQCEKEILTYQKDGPGILKRMYLDRILAPDRLVGLQNVPLKEIPNLVCPKCKAWLATPYIYKKETRKAYKLFVGAITKKITKA